MVIIDSDLTYNYFLMVYKQLLLIIAFRKDIGHLLLPVSLIVTNNSKNKDKMAKNLSVDTIVVILFYLVLIGVLANALSILLKPPTAFEEKRMNEDVRLPSFTIVSNAIEVLCSSSFTLIHIVAS